MDHNLPALFDFHIYSCNLTAYLNMLQILLSIRNGNKVSARFQRGQQQQQ
jgi:hypothetical protein